MATFPFTISPDTTIENSRVFNFPVALLYSAWSNPEHLQRWWGPMGFTNTFHRFDFREGGHWEFTMHGPDKGNYQNHVEFVKIDEPNLIAWKRHSKPLFNIVATFEEVEGNKSKLVFRMVFDTPEECSKLKPYVVDKNEENFDRLEAELAAMASL